jgi:hypothetical protein
MSPRLVPSDNATPLVDARLFTAEDQQAQRPQRELEQALRQGRAAHDNWLVRKDASRFWVTGPGAGRAAATPGVVHDVCDISLASRSSS